MIENDDAIHDSDISESERQQTVDWDQHVFVEEEQSHSKIALDAKDYVALFLAALQTLMLPLVILMVLLLIIGLYLGLRFSWWAP